MHQKIDINKLASTKQPKVGNVLFIAIDGHGGSGKSTLAKWLSEKFNAEIIHTDDFAAWDNPLDWWPLVIERIFKPIKSGATKLNYPRSKWTKEHSPEPVIDQPITSIMLLEGVSSLRQEFREYISLGIFVDTPEEICLERGISRDLKDGKTSEEVRQMWQDWMMEENEYFERDNPKKYADLVIDGTKGLEDQLL